MKGNLPKVQDYQTLYDALIGITQIEAGEFINKRKYKE